MVIPLVVSMHTMFVLFMLMHTLKLASYICLSQSNELLKHLPYDLMTIGK
jgi:hypothetical protein